MYWKRETQRSYIIELFSSSAFQSEMYTHASTCEQLAVKPFNTSLQEWSVSNSGKIQFGHWQKFPVLLEIHPVKWILHSWVWMQTAKSSANINLSLYMSIMSWKTNLSSLSPRQHTIVTIFMAGSFPSLKRLYDTLSLSMW